MLTLSTLFGEISMIWLAVISTIERDIKIIKVHMLAVSIYDEYV